MATLSDVATQVYIVHEQLTVSSLSCQSSLCCCCFCFAVTIFSEHHISVKFCFLHGETLLKLLLKLANKDAMVKTQLLWIGLLKAYGRHYKFVDSGNTNVDTKLHSNNVNKPKTYKVGIRKKSKAVKLNTTYSHCIPCVNEI